MEDIWSSVPTYRKTVETDFFDIEDYFNNLYESKKSYLFKTYKDNIAEKMLEDYKSGELSNLKKLYYDRFNHLLTSFKENLDKDNSRCRIKLILYGPDHNYSYEEEQILNNALTHFCFRLSIKNYPYDLTEEQERVDDFMDGKCTIGYKILKITLK